MAVRGMPMGAMKGMWFQAAKAAPMSAVLALPPIAMPVAPQPGQAMAMPVAVEMAMLPPQGLLPPPPLPGAMGRLNFAGNDFAMQNAIRAESAMKKRAQIFDKEMAASREPGGDLIVVREFAHQVRKNRKPTDRLDFSQELERVSLDAIGE